MRKELKEIKNLLKRAGDEILKIYEKNYQIKEKDDKSLVTEADLISEKVILKGLKKYNYGILSEETEDNLSRLKKEKVWIIDPLDGTQDFLEKVIKALDYQGSYPNLEKFDWKNLSNKLEKLLRNI